MVYSVITLYDATEREFKTAGLGNLYNDTVSCSVHEEKNGEFELSMTYRLDGEFAYLIKNDNIIYARPNPYDNPQPFRIYDVSLSLDEVLTISAHHISYDLDGYVLEPFHAVGPSAVAMEINAQMQQKPWNTNKPSFSILPASNFQAPGELSDDSRTTPCSVRSILGGFSDSLIEKYGIELSYDKFTVWLNNHRGEDRGVCIQYGVNLLDLEQESNDIPVYDVFPFYYKESGEESLYINYSIATSTSQNTILVNPLAATKRTELLDLSNEFDDIPTKAEFAGKAVELASQMMPSSGNLPINLTLSFVSLKDSANYQEVSQWTEDVRLGDTVTVVYHRSNQEYVRAKAECISTTYDVLTGKYTEIQLGKARSSLTSTIAGQGADTDNRIGTQLRSYRNYYDEAVKQQTALITGNKGGYVIIQDSDGDGYPDRILVMDDLDITRAQHIWQWNKQGLGYSDNNGKDYIMGMDMEGHINGKLLTANSVQANEVLTGYLGNPDSGNYWNLNTGEFRLVAVTGSTVGGKLIATEEYAAQYADQKLEDFITKDYLPAYDSLKTQTDQKAETWYQGDDPSNAWTNESLKSEHIGDLWYCTDENNNTYYQKSWVWNGTAWEEMTSTPPEEVFDQIDKKRQVFISTPTVPYMVGDLWFQNESSDIMTCIETRKIGAFNPDDWQKRNKYIDQEAADKVLQDFINGTYNIQYNALKSQVDQKAETWYQDINPADAWNTDELKAEHRGDIWYCTNINYETFYQKSWVWNGTAWEEIKGVPDELIDTIDGKAQVFVSQPTTPYYEGDLWFQGSNGDILTCIETKESGAFDSNNWEKRNNYIDLEKAKKEVNDFINGTYSRQYNALKSQVDQKAETWYQDINPADAWNTDELKAEHRGDIWYCTNINYETFYQKSWVWNGTAWEEIKGVPDAMYDKFDKKARVFVSQPNPPYNEHDLWCQEVNPDDAQNSGNILTCIQTRLSGAFVPGDWIKLNKYISQGDADTAASNAAGAAEANAKSYADTVAGTAESNAKSYVDLVVPSTATDIFNTKIDDFNQNTLTQLTIFNKLTNNGTANALALDGGLLYINATMIQSGILSLGPVAGLVPEMLLKNSSQTIIARMNKDGLRFEKDTKVAMDSYHNTSVLNETGLYFRTDNQSTLEIMPFYSSKIPVGKSKPPAYTGLNAVLPLYVVANGTVYARFKGVYDDGFNKDYKNSSVYFPSYVWTYGLTVGNGGKNRSVETENYGTRLLYSYEMPSPMFGDVGEAVTDDQGCCVINIDNVFEETIVTRIEYQVFLQKEGSGDVWVDKKTQNYFVVRGTPNLRFSWELKAKQKDLSDKRLDRIDSIERTMNDHPDVYEYDYTREREKLIKEREDALYGAN